MRTFRFSLESLLILQTQKRDECLGKLSTINRRVLQCHQKIKSVAAEREQLRIFLGTQSAQSVVDVGLMSRCHIHLAQLEYQQNRVEMELDEIQQVLKNLRQELVEEEKKVKALEKLKEKQLEEYRLRLEMRSRREQEDNLAARLIRDFDS